MSACSKVVPYLQSAHRAHRKSLSYLSLLLWRDYIILFHLSSMVKYLLNPKITIRRYRFSFRLFIPQMVPRAAPPTCPFLPRLSKSPPESIRLAGLLPDSNVIQRVEIAESPVKRAYPSPFQSKGLYHYSLFVKLHQKYDPSLPSKRNTAGIVPIVQPVSMQYGPQPRSLLSPCHSPTSMS